MKVELIETATNLEYRVSEVPNKYKEGLLHYFFEENNGVYTKVYDKENFMFEHNVNILKENFEKSLEDMIANTLGNSKMDWEESLIDIIEIMEKNNINWWLAGSAACAVRGINITPGDIDLMTYKTEIDKIEKAFKDYIIEPFTHVNDWIVKGFGTIYLKGKIDFAFEPEESSDDYGKMDFGVYAMNNLETIIWNGHSIKVPPIELHILSNEVRGRSDRVRLIKDYIKEKID